MNNVMLLGRITKDVELKQAGNVSAVNFTLAVDRKFKKEGSPDADFISCVIFGKQAEAFAKFLQKGIRIAIEGRIQNDSWTDKEGSKQYSTKVIAESFYFADGKKNSKESNDGWIDAGLPVVELF